MFKYRHVKIRLIDVLFKWGDSIRTTDARVGQRPTKTLSETIKRYLNALF